MANLIIFVAMAVCITNKTFFLGVLLSDSAQPFCAGQTISNTLILPLGFLRAWYMSLGQITRVGQSDGLNFDS